MPIKYLLLLIGCLYCAGIQAQNNSLADSNEQNHTTKHKVKYVDVVGAGEGVKPLVLDIDRLGEVLQGGRKVHVVVSQAPKTLRRYKGIKRIKYSNKTATFDLIPYIRSKYKTDALEEIKINAPKAHRD